MAAVLRLRRRRNTSPGTALGDSPSDGVTRTDGGEFSSCDGPTGGPSSRSVLILVIASMIIAADQATKAWAVNALDGRIIDLVWTLRLRLAFNTGFAFSAGRGLGRILALVAIVIAVVLWSMRRRVRGLWPALALAGVIGGALGNLADRLFRGDGWGSGAVVDFIDLQWWPIFNLADASISVSLVALLTFIYFDERGTRSATGTRSEFCDDPS